MKSIMSLFTAFFLLCSCLLKSDGSGLKIGDTMPMADAKMTSISNERVSLKDLQGENGLLVIFSCNTCPFVLAWENRYNDLFNLAKRNKIGMVLVNSNEAKRGGDDSLEAMKMHAEDQAYKMPYVLDADHLLADAFGAKTTPHIFLFNKNHQLAYTGAIDDNGKDKSAVTQPYLSKALTELGSGNLKCAVPETKAIGCSIKRLAKK